MGQIRKDIVASAKGIQCDFKYDKQPPECLSQVKEDS